MLSDDAGIVITADSAALFCYIFGSRAATEKLGKPGYVI
jgi:hypothetical protein